MAERQTGNQAVQWGVETTAGTAVAASKKLRSIDTTLNPAGEVMNFRPQGSKLSTVVVPGKEWTGGKLSGKPVYDEIEYPLSAMLGAATITTVDTTGKQWVWAYTAGAALTPKTFTVEKGDSVRAGKAANILVTDFSMDISRSEVSIDGSVMGALYSDGITMTGSPTTFAQIPILPQSWNLYVDSTSGAIGTTQFLRGFSANISFGGLYNGVWPLNNTLTSFATTVENTEPDITAELRVEADATGMAFLTQLRAGGTKFIRLKSTSPTLAGSASAFYSLQIDFAAKISDYFEFDDEDGLYVIPVPLRIVDDTWGSLNITLVNQTAAL